jgi:hypothetical protein
MITLQQAKPAIMFKSPKILTARSSSPNRNIAIVVPHRGRETIVDHRGRSQTNSPPATGHESRRSKPQLEAANWLYQMILANTAGSDEHTAPGSDQFTAGQSSEHKTHTSLTNRASAPTYMTKLPSLQRLNQTSILAVFKESSTGLDVFGACGDPARR